MDFIMFIIQIFLAFFIASMIVSIVKSKKRYKQELSEFQERMAKYENLSKNDLLELPSNEIKEAITFNLLDLVDSRYDEALIEFNETQKMFYTMYQLELSCKTQKGTVNDFFVKAKELVKYAPIMFDELDIESAKNIFNDARELFLKFEKEYEMDIEEVLATNEVNEEEKNFLDYSDELKEIFNSQEYLDKLATYCKNNIDELYIEMGE